MANRQLGLNSPRQSPRRHCGDCFANCNILNAIDQLSKNGSSAFLNSHALPSRSWNVPTVPHENRLISTRKLQISESSTAVLTLLGAKDDAMRDNHP
jgi:hypothetical protein